MPAPRLIVGLGNPGPEYESTRHNAGFWFVDCLADELRVSLVPQAKFFGVAGKSGDAWLLKPMLYMNRSGQAVAALARFYKIEAGEILVVHDELDLEPGTVRLKQGGGNAGHNGLKDITAQLGTPDFWRLRIGIGHPRSLGLKQDVVDFVLHRPRAGEATAIDDALTHCLKAWNTLSTGDYPAAMQKLHALSATSPR